LLLAVPITYLLNLQLIKPLQLPERENVLSALTRIQEQVEVAKPRGDILFMDQRQLLTFGFIQNVFLIDEYEKKYVMDKALSGDVLYFEQFYQDLANHRFSLIISEKLFIKTEDLSSPFSEENDAWVKWVSVPLLTYYKPLATLNSVGVQLLVPRR
jgi:hypothetical protein